MTDDLPVRNSQRASKIFKVKFIPFDICVDVASGTLILDAIKKAHLPLKATCGGKGTCGDCIVQIVSGTFQSKPSAILSEKLISQGYALACVTGINDNLTIQLPQFQELSIKSIACSKFFDEHKNDISGIFENKALLEKIDLQLAPPSLEDNYGDLTGIQIELLRKYKIQNPHCEYSVLKKLAHTVREKDGQISVVLFKTDQSTTIIDVKPADEKQSIYGISCDIGTTTVALQLVDFTSGEILNTASGYNQQLKCGEDIISRINYAQKPGRLDELHSLILLTINQLIEKATEGLQIAASDIYYAAISGNTTMLHLFLNLEPRYIREEPYVPTLNQVPFIPARELGLAMNHEARVFCAPAVGSYVGGDISAGLLCTPILRDAEKISLFIDIGTNGELVVGNQEWLITCACSAGPAFEGNSIKCGLPATDGAIEQVKIKHDGALTYKVIGSDKPKGVCGSGLIDILAEMFIHGIIDRYGKFNEKKAGSRFLETEAGKGFLIENGRNCYWGRDLFITENDIANLIRTKGAVFSAFSLLMKYVGLSFGQVDSFYIAGGFGQHLNIENAIRIGLFPDLERNKFHYLGNSSLLGAYLILISDTNRKLVNEIAEKITYIELNTEPDYMNEYTGALFLPHTDMDLFPTVKEML